MIFDEIKDIIIDQLQVEESEVTMDTNLMTELSAESVDAVELIMGRSTVLRFRMKMRKRSRPSAIS